MELIDVSLVIPPVDVDFLRDEVVDMVYDAIRFNNIIKPVTVEKTESGKCNIVAGKEIYEAYKRLEYKEIPCEIIIKGE